MMNITMIPIKEDILANFVQVMHMASGDLFKIHKDDLVKLGTGAKVAVYEDQSVDYIPPNTQYPKGKYRAKVKYFVAAGLCQPPVDP